MSLLSESKEYLLRKTLAAPLAVFRICFGLMMLGGIIRFVSFGWVDKFYIQPLMTFSYAGFEWVKPLGHYTYLLFAIAGLSALLMAIGFLYRIASVLFFLSFTYIELMDKTTYLNHYYFISLLAFLMIFLPAQVYFSVDAWKNPKRRFQYVANWQIDAIKWMIMIVYFYAGLAKLNSDWLLEAMPLKIWLTAKYHTPIVGGLLQLDWVHYAFSWMGTVYDLSIPFLLWFSRTRSVAFMLVVVFHLMTALLFPIGLFPYVMIVSAIIFFDPGFHQKLINTLASISSIPKKQFDNGLFFKYTSEVERKAVPILFSFFFILQIILPFRYLGYPGELFWTEKGFRFSWRVMLMEKAGYAQFKVVEPQTGANFYVDNSRFLTPLQEKHMSTQPDFMLEYARWLENYYKKQGIQDPEIYVESYVALNGRPSQPYVNPDVDLTKIIDKGPRNWLLPFNDTIYGL